MADNRKNSSAKERARQARADLAARKREQQEVIERHQVDFFAAQDDIDAFEAKIDKLRAQIAQLEAERDALAEEVRALREQAAGRRPQRSGELVHVPRSTSVVMWSPRTARERKRARGRGNGQD